IARPLLSVYPDVADQREGQMSFALSHHPSHLQFDPLSDQEHDMTFVILCLYFAHGYLYISLLSPHKK
ncbi:MAG: hypothetical protein ACRDD3_13025, partial [Azovibrio sp.]